MNTHPPSWPGLSRPPAHRRRPMDARERVWPRRCRQVTVDAISSPTRLPSSTEPSRRRAAKAARGYWRKVAQRVSRDPTVAIICILILLAIILAAVFAPFVSPDDPYKTSMLRRLKPPGTPGHILGTDELGRDLLARLIYGGRVSLAMGLAPVAIATLPRRRAGHHRRLLRTLGQRPDHAYRRYLLRLPLRAAGRRDGRRAGFGYRQQPDLADPGVHPTDRPCRGKRHDPDPQPGLRRGGPRHRRIITSRIIVEHLLANVSGPILTYASSLVSVAIIIASGLSFLGLGASPPTADWGLMLNTLRQAIYVAPVNAVLPGVMIFAASVSFNLLSDSFRQRHGHQGMSDPRDRGGPRQPLLTVEKLRKYFPLKGGAVVQAVDGVSFQRDEGGNPGRRR